MKTTTRKQIGDVVMVLQKSGAKEPYVVTETWTPSAAELSVAPDLVQTILAKGTRNKLALFNVWADGRILNAL